MVNEVECVAKQWGGSIGVVIPKEIVDKEHIKPEEKVRITVQKVVLARDIWGLGPIKLKKPAQEIKNELKKGWS